MTEEDFRKLSQEITEFVINQNLLDSLSKPRSYWSVSLEDAFKLEKPSLLFNETEDVTEDLEFDKVENGLYSVEYKFMLYIDLLTLLYDAIEDKL